MTCRGDYYPEEASANMDSCSIQDEHLISNSHPMLWIQWIPGERPPRNKGTYLVTIQDSEKHTDAQVTTDFWLGEDWYECGTLVIAWCPLPQPYVPYDPIAKDE